MSWRKSVAIDKIRCDELRVQKLMVGGDPLNGTNAKVSPQTASFTIGAEGTDAIAVAVQLKDGAGVDLPNKASVRAYLSGDSAGNSLATAPATSVAIGTDGLILPSGGDSKLIFDLVSEDDGDVDIVITHTGGDNMYLCLVMPNGEVVISGVIDFAT